jgi:aryl-alcohol dehydrogenase-like predicted oxidoreductase
MGNGDQGLDPGYIARAVDASLKRLQTDRIDLYQAHKDDDKTRLGDTLGAFDRLVEQGKVRFIGASNYSGARLQEAIEISEERDIASYQTMELAPVVAEYGLGVIPYFSLAGGFLSGKYRSEADAQGKARGGMVGKYLNARGFAVIAELEEVAREYNATPASVALAWLIAQPGITAPIASATNGQQLAELVKATELELDRTAIGKLSVVSAPSNAASRV